MLRIVASAVALVASVAACNTSPGPLDTKLSQAAGNPDLSIAVDFPDTTNLGFWAPPDGPPPWDVTLGTWSHGTANICVAPAADTVATLNGQTLAVIEPGWAGGGVCELPQWSIPAVPSPLADSMSFVLQDSSGSLEADFIHVTQPRTIGVVSPSSGVAHVGDTIVLQLSPSTDVFPTSPDDMDHYGCLEVSGINATFVSYQQGLATFVVDQPGGSEVSLNEDGMVGTSRCDVGHCDMEFSLTTPAVPLSVVP